MCIRDRSDVETHAFWNREVISESLLSVAQVRRPSELTAEGAALELNARRSVGAGQVALETGYAPPPPKA
eukprot:13539478-Alexandrium_andersonii.AAC.1